MNVNNCCETKKITVPTTANLILLLVLLSVIALVVIVTLGVLFYKKHKQRRRTKAVSSDKNGTTQVRSDLADEGMVEFSYFYDGHGLTVSTDMLSKHGGTSAGVVIYKHKKKHRTKAVSSNKNGTPEVPSDLADVPAEFLDFNERHVGVSTVPPDLEDFYEAHGGVSTVPPDLESGRK